MQMLSEDDLNLRDMTPEELDAAWDRWFDLAQATNDAARPTRGVFVGTGREGPRDVKEPARSSSPAPGDGSV